MTISLSLRVSAHLSFLHSSPMWGTWSPLIPEQTLHLSPSQRRLRLKLLVCCGLSLQTNQGTLDMALSVLICNY